MVAIQTTDSLTNEIGSFVNIVFEKNCKAVYECLVNKEQTFPRTEMDQMEMEMEKEMGLTYNKQRTLSFNPPTSMQLMQ